MILCDACDHGNHRGCIDNLGKFAPGKNDRWLCTGCRCAGTRIELWDRTSRQYLPAVIERSYKNGLVVDVIYDDGNMEQVYSATLVRRRRLDPEGTDRIDRGGTVST